MHKLNNPANGLSKRDFLRACGAGACTLCLASLLWTKTAGAQAAPKEVNEAFASLAANGYHFVRPARKIYWKNTDTDYWIQWTHDKDEVAVLWAYDPEAKKPVEVLRIREK